MTVLRGCCIYLIDNGPSQYAIKGRGSQDSPDTGRNERRTADLRRDQDDPRYYLNLVIMWALSVNALSDQAFERACGQFVDCLAKVPNDYTIGVDSYGHLAVSTESSREIDEFGGDRNLLECMIDHGHGLSIIVDTDVTGMEHESRMYIITSTSDICATLARDGGVFEEPRSTITPRSNDDLRDDEPQGDDGASVTQSAGTCIWWRNYHCESFPSDHIGCFAGDQHVDYVQSCRNIYIWQDWDSVLYRHPQREAASTVSS